MAEEASSTSQGDTLLTQAQTDLKSLDRVSHRLALLTDDKLPEILDKLLPRLLIRVGENHQAILELTRQKSSSPSSSSSTLLLVKQKYDSIHAKLIEMLSHAMKRARSDAHCALPCRAILENLVNMDDAKPKANVDSFTMNLSLAFLTIGVPRCADYASLLPSLLILFGHGSVDTYYMDTTSSRRLQSNQFAHLLLKCLEGMVVQEQSKRQIPVRQGNVDVDPSQPSSTPLQQAKQLLQAPDSIIAASLYDLLLDVLLFQPTRQESGIPPDGMSASGAQRLAQGHSVTARDWLAEVAQAGRRSEVNLHLLDLVAPSRVWAMLLSDNNNMTAADGISSNDIGEAMEVDDEDKATAAASNLSRTLALLVVASGDPALDVADRAKGYLKMYFDTFRNKSLVHGLGDALSLAIHMLSLCTGKQQAEAAIKSILVENEDVGGRNALGTHLRPIAAVSLQASLNAKRRPVSESTMTVLAQFVATTVYEDQPTMFDNADSSAVKTLAALSNLVASRSLSSVTSASGLTKLKGRPFAAVANLLNALSVRLASYYDMQSDEERKAISEYVAKSMSIACSTLEVVANRPSTSSSQRTVLVDEGNIAVRDACYGVLSTLCRSHFAQAPEGFVFNCGTAISGSLTSNDTFSVSVSTAKLLFMCAANEEEKLRHRAVATLDALLAAYCRVYVANVAITASTPASYTAPSNPWATSPKPMVESVLSSRHRIDKKALSRSMLPLLWTAAQVHLPKASRVAASRWSSQLLLELDLTNGCHLLCFLSGDVDPTAASSAREGLGLANVDHDAIPLPSEELRLPKFNDFVANVFGESKMKEATLDRRQRYWDFSQHGKATALRLGLLALLSDFYDGDEGSTLEFLSTICTTLQQFVGKSVSVTNDRQAVDLLEETSLALLVTASTSQFIRKHILTDKATISLTDLVTLALGADSSRARRHAASLVGKLFEDVEFGIISLSSESGLQIWVERSRIQETLATCNEKLSLIRTNSFSLGQVHGSAFLGAHAIRACRLRSNQSTSGTNTDLWVLISHFLAALAAGLAYTDEVVGNACADAVAIAFSFDGLDAPVLDVRLYDSSAVILTNLSKALPKYGDGSTVEVLRALKLSKAAGVCLGSTTSASGSLSGRIDCVNALFGLLGSNAFRQNEELALVVGEALALYADSFSPSGVRWSSTENDLPVEYVENAANDMPPHQHVLYVLLRRLLRASSPLVRTACAPALVAIVARVAKGLNTNLAYAERLLTQVTTLHLSEIQQAFIQLLSDPKIRHLSRECCCLGLAACRGIAGSVDVVAGTKELNKRLLSAFGQTTQYAGSAMIETAEQAATRRVEEGRNSEATADGPVLMEQFGFENEVGGVANLSEAALGAYREMAAASVALGRDDILYNLLFLSISHTCWASEDYRDRYSASCLLGSKFQNGTTSNARQMRDILRPEMGKLIPRILRARYDPNPHCREQMTTLWNGLTGGGADSRDMITQHFTSTVDVLLKDAANKLWRARCGALGALADIIVGREWEDLGGGGAVLEDDDLNDGSPATAAVRLLRLWRTAIRALDDVRGAVREAGEALARSIKALTIRLCDSDQASSQRKRTRKDDDIACQRHSAAAAATSLRWLCRHGLSQQCAEAAGICVSTLIDVISLPSISGLLHPVLPDLLKSLLLAMSGLEPAALNYLQLRTNDQEGLERIRLQMAQSGPMANAVQKCLDIVPQLNDEHQRAVITQLDTALRLSAGFATRAAVADAVSTLCSTCPSAFRSPSTGNLNPSVRLLRAFFYASERERGEGAKDKMIHALGNLAALCPGASVRSLAIRACEGYTRSTGSNDDPISRRASAAALRAIATRASHQFSDGRIWTERILPTAFLGRKDADKKAAAYWKEVWDEGGSAVAISDYSSADTFGTRLEEKLLPRLVDECIRALRHMSWSRRAAGATALVDLCSTGVLNPLPSSAKVSIVSDAYSMGRARYRAEAACSALQECVLLISKPRLWEGKGGVIDAAVQLAFKWCFVEVSPEYNSKLVYGWNDPVTPCPWKPVSVSQNCPDDLLLGDKFFVDDGNSADITLDEATQSPDHTEVETQTDEQLNISEFDAEEVRDECQDSCVRDLLEKRNFIPVSLTGLCRLLLSQALTNKQVYSDYSLSYRACAFKCLTSLLSSIQADESALRPALYSLLSPVLLNFLNQAEEKPVLIAGALDSLGETFYQEIGSQVSSATPSQLVPDILGRLKVIGGDKQTAWTVRQASTLCIAKLVESCRSEELRQPSTISSLVHSAEVSLKDKFWKVRLAGVKLLQALILRAGTSADRNLLVLEAILPHKETILRLLRTSLRDSEAAVTALGTEVLSSLSWWP